MLRLLKEARLWARSANGQGIVEYVLILVVIVTVIMLASLSLIQERTSNSFSDTSNELANAF